MSLPFLLCQEVTKYYAGGETVVKALQGVSFSVNQGDFLCIMGRSGSGKTTLLNCIGTLDQITSGEIFLDGEPVHHFSEKMRLLVRRRKIGFVFQEPFLFPYLSAMDNAALPLVYRGLSWKDARAQARPLLEQVDLGRRVNHPAKWLSGGEAQRVAVARALVSNSSLLLADEPTAELDTASSEEIIRLLSTQRRKGTTLIVATHDQAVQKQANQTIHLVDGKVI